MRKCFFFSLIFLFSVLISVHSYASGGKNHSNAVPQYFSFEDLRSGIADEYFYFENGYKPDNALVWLDTYLQYNLCASKNAVIAKKIAANPSKFKINNMHLYANWNDSSEISVDWNSIATSARRGDLIFTRSNSKAGNLVKYISNWTHVAIVDDPQRKYVFEATPDNGVNSNDGPATWKSITYYTCKTIETIQPSQRTYLLDQGKSKYANLPYFPKENTNLGRAKFIFDWSNRDDLGSMYCSKLVYNVFKPYINLDSGRTSVIDAMLQDKACVAYMFSWIGVSPDDIYYSSSLGPDFAFSPNVNTL
jgi:hypothetical protein